MTESSESKPKKVNIADRLRGFSKRASNLQPNQPLPEESPYQMFQMESIEPPMTRLCEQLAGDFTEGRYGIIVGDDINGRVPALILRGVASHILKEKGRPNIPLVFVRSGRYLNEKEVGEQVMQRLSMQAQQPQTALIVTEYIERGGGLVKLVDALKKQGIKVDVAALRVSGLDTVLGDTLVFSGETMNKEPNFWGNALISGFSRTTEKDPKITIFGRKSLANQTMVNRSRADVKIMVQRITRSLALNQK